MTLRLLDDEIVGRTYSSLLPPYVHMVHGYFSEAHRLGLDILLIINITTPLRQGVREVLPHSSPTFRNEIFPLLYSLSHYYNCTVVALEYHDNRNKPKEIVECQFASVFRVLSF